MSLILILEDSRIMAEAVVEALSSAGHEAVYCLTATEALSLCQELRPDLVLAELHLSEGSGLEFLEKLGRLSLSSPPPVLMVTGCGREESAARAMALGAWDYRLKTEAYLSELPGQVGRVLGEWAARQAKREKDRLRRRLEAQNELAGWLAHNFKNILAASIGYLNLIDLKNPDQARERQIEFLTESRRSQESAVGLLEQLIRMTEAEAGESERTIVAEVADQAWAKAKAKILSGTAAQYPDQVETVRAGLERVVFMNSARRLEPVHAVRADLGSMLEALLQNALEAVLTAEDPRVLVLAEKNGEDLEITVKDNGRGMSESVLRHALEPFFSTKGEVGVGLSLSLVSSLLMRHGGDIKLRSAPGAGSTVKISLPL